MINNLMMENKMEKQKIMDEKIENFLDRQKKHRHENPDGRHYYSDAIDWFRRQEKRDMWSLVEAAARGNDLQEVKHLIRIINFVLSPRSSLLWAIFAVEQAMPIYKKKYPEDNTVKKNMEMIRQYRDNPNKETMAKFLDRDWQFEDSRRHAEIRESDIYAASFLSAVDLVIFADDADVPAATAPVKSAINSVRFDGEIMESIFKYATALFDEENPMREGGEGG